MPIIIEDILRLHLDEKMKFFHAKKENLAKEDGLPENGNLSGEIIMELERRAEMAEKGEATWMEKDELLDFLKKRRGAV